ncbi:hypothetical protein [Nostoc sp.]|uniref:hypothetical protein n=1 Tax=Nostoc sp. TaxID=1180 RepID=UPI002FFC95A6
MTIDKTYTLLANFMKIRSFHIINFARSQPIGNKNLLHCIGSVLANPETVNTATSVTVAIIRKVLYILSKTIYLHLQI